MSKVEVPRYTKADLKKYADEFRKKHWQERSSPIDIWYIAEFDLRIRFIPTADLEKETSTSALIASDFSSMYVDLVQFEDEKFLKRNNFSLAHEIGHLVLHREYYENLKIKSYEDLYKYYEKLPKEEYDFLERQVNYFAACLLVPEDELKRVMDDLYTQIVNGSIDTSSFGSKISDHFQVSSDVIINRIVYDGIKIDPKIVECFGL